MLHKWSQVGQETIREQFPVTMLHHCPMPNRKLSANSFLPPCPTTTSCWTGNYPRTVSCCYAPPLSHAGWETIREQFPAAMPHHYLMLDRKLSANSFLLLCSTTAPCRTGNYPPIVSCRYAPPLSHAGWETIREQFPAAMLHYCPMPDGKPFANSFLSPCSTTAPRRTGNYPRAVSCHHAPPLPHDAQETIREQFPVAMLHHCPMPDGKLSANSFLSLCSTTAPCCTGNFSQAASYHHAPPLPHAAQETFRKQLPIIMLRHCPMPDGKP